MKTISILAYNRPHYLAQCLEALSKCRGVEEYGVLISVDGGGSKVENVPPNLKAEVTYLPMSYGIDEHNFMCYEALFKTGKIDFNVALEDDVVLTPDALELANWFYNHPRNHEFAYLCLGDPEYSGWLPAGQERDYTSVRETQKLYTSAWCFADTSWSIMREMWNRKLETQLGWDWSLSYTILEHAWRGLAPVVSRARNIGREGVHAYPEWFDVHVAPAAYSDGRQSEFRIERHFESQPGWFEREVNAQYGRQRNG